MFTLYLKAINSRIWTFWAVGLDKTSPLNEKSLSEALLILLDIEGYLYIVLLIKFVLYLLDTCVDSPTYSVNPA